MENTVNNLRGNIWANYFILFIRMLIGLAFIPSGLVKLFGERFTTISTDQPIGYFFEGLYQTGLYWTFLGFAQVFAAFLLMTQRYSRIGALIFFGIISNIVVITLSMYFNFTPVITILMWLANFALILWEWPILKPVFTGLKNENEITPELLSKKWSWFGLFFFVFLVLTISAGRFFPEATWFIYVAGALFLAFLFFAVKIFISDYRKSRNRLMTTNH